MLRLSVALIILFSQMLFLAFPHPVFAAQEKSLAAPLEISALSAVVMDENGEILYAKEPHRKLPPASVTKTMTLLLAVEAVEQGRVKLADEIVVSETAWRQGGSQIWLEPGERMTVHEILTAVAVVSANDAAVALMEHIFGSQQAAIGAMNERARALGLQNTKFASVNGLPAPDHYMSAYDTALIAREALKHPLYMQMIGIKEHWLRNGKNWLVNTNKLLWWYPGADGMKTGWTEEAKYCFVGTAKRDNLRLISVVFATPEPRSHLRETMKLFDWGFANYTAVPIVEKGALVGRVKVNKGVEKEVRLIAADRLSVVIPKGHNKNVQKNVSMENSISAPIAAGQKYGELVITTGGKEAGKIDLVAEKAIDKAGLPKIFHDMMLNLYSVSR